LLSNEEDGGTISQPAVDDRHYSAVDGARVVVILDANGRVVVATDPTDLPGEDFSNRPEIATALTGDAGGRRTRLQHGRANRMVYVAVPVLSGPACRASCASPSRPPSSTKARIAESRGLLLVFVISLIGAVVAALFMASGVTSPLSRLRAAPSESPPATSTERADEHATGPPEVRSLARSFNSMTERISGLVDKQRAFAGDASHQLRTPLTALRLQLERAATRWSSTTRTGLASASKRPARRPSGCSAWWRGC
jgi:signal transduction histidine kinase